jgi:hypothetical protein
MKDKLKSIAINTLISFAKGAAAGFTFSVGSRLASDLIDRVQGTKQVETKRDSRVSVRDVSNSKLN